MNHAHLVAAAGVVGVGHREPHGGVAADRARRDPRGGRALRPQRAARGRRGLRRHRGARRARLPDPRVPVAQVQPAHRRVRRLAREPHALRRSRCSKRCAPRSATGVAVGVRLVGDEEQRDGHGLGPDDCAEIAARFAERGLVDFLNVSVGTSGVGMVRPMYAPHLLGVRATAIVKKAVPDIPVFAVHRILTPDEAEGILERGEADAVTLVRALIADPEWADKARDGRAGEIRRVHRLQPGLLRQPHAGLSDHVRDEPESSGREADARERHAARRPRRASVSSWSAVDRRARGRVGRGRAWSRRRRCSSARPSSAARSASRRCCPGAARSPTSPTGAPSECARRGVDIRLGCRRRRRRGARARARRGHRRDRWARDGRHAVEVAPDADRRRRPAVGDRPRARAARRRRARASAS